MSQAGLKPVRFGSLLVELNLLTEAQLADALQVAPQFSLPLGRTLVLSGLLTEEELRLVVELQPLISNRSCSMEQASRAAIFVRQEKRSAEEALRYIGIEGAQDRTNLGTLLLEAGLISHQQLEQSKKSSYETGLRLGRVLVLNGFISHSLLTRALHLQSMVREKRISQQQSVEMLMSETALKSGQSLKMEANAMAPAPARKNVLFGEFLVLAGLATEAEMLHAMETSLTKQLSLEEAIIEMGLVSKKIYERLLKLHAQVSSGELALQKATNEIHRMVFGDNRSIVTPPVLGELLKMTGFVSDVDIQEAIELSNKYPSLIGKMLVISGAIDEAILIASLRCQFLLKHGVIDTAQAVSALQFCKENRVSFDDALTELDISKEISE